MKKRMRKTSLHLAVHASLIALVFPSFSMAQQSSQTLDRIEVTGSRIKRAAMEGQVPVQTLTREDLDRSGYTSIADVLQTLTGSGSALNTKFNSSGNFGFPPDGSGVGAGSAQVDLRHLGPRRVLVLVDGMRWVNESSASGVGASIDLNTIPMAIVDRIEVLEDGASSLYGSDAIAGVVNIITRRNVDGGQVSLGYGRYGEGDGASTNADLSWGMTGERSSVFIGLSHVDQKVIYARDREQSSLPTPGTGLTFGSSGTPTGRFIFTDPNTGQTHDITPNTGVANPAYDPAQACNRSDGFHCFGAADRFNFAQYNMLLTPSKRTGLYGQYRFNFNEKTSWYVKALANRRESTNQAAPEPIFLGPEAGTGNPLADNIFISRLNPYNPFGFDLDSSSNLIMIGRRPVEGGARVFNQKVDTQYIGTGVEGSLAFGEKTYFWDVNLAYGKNSADQTNFGSYNIRNIALALGDPAACAAVTGCVPLNIFAGGSITNDMLGWIQPVVRDRSEQTLGVFSANFSGDLFNGWAGPVSFATGYEYRKYKGWYQPDALTVAGHYNGVPSQPTSGSYDVNEVFVEVNVPLWDSASNKMDFSLAGRYSKYSTFGGEFTPKLGLRWQLSDELVLRTTWAKGFRAPSIGELYGSDSRFDATLTDPCTEPFLDPSVAPNCRTLGVPAGYAQTNPQISVTTGGNQALEPERSESFSAGFVWSPSFAANTGWSERLDFGVTFYRHDLEGAIQAIDAQTQLNLCVASLDPLYCDGITRASTGGINGFNNRLTNLGAIKTDGWDVDLFWASAKRDAGQFSLSWRNTFVGRYHAVGAAGQVQPRKPGVEVNDSAIPEWTSTLVGNWRASNWHASWTVRHIDELTEQCGRAVSFAVCSDQARGINVLPATTYHDLQLGYRFGWLKGLGVSVGANNVFDKDPPICVSCSLNGYDMSTYDIPGGRYFYVKADLSF